LPKCEEPWVLAALKLALHQNTHLLRNPAIQLDLPFGGLSFQ